MLKKINFTFFAKISLFMLFIFVITIFSISNIFASGGLNVILANQNPDPVSPGNYVYLNVKLSNINSEPVKDVKISFIENDNFKLEDIEDKVKEIGILSPYSSGSSQSYVIAKYKILVKETTPLGLNKVNFKVTTNSGNLNFEFDVLVEDKNPIIELREVKVLEVEPGENTQMKLTVRNSNSINLKNIRIALDLAQVDQRVLNVIGDSNEKNINLLKAFESSQVVYDLSLNPDASSKLYLIPVKIFFEDSLDNIYEKEVFTSIKVYSKPSLSLKLSSQNIYNKGRGEVNLAIANPGSSLIKGVELEVLESLDYRLISGEKQYIGDLNPDDYQNLKLNVFLNNDKKTVLKVKLNYYDSYNKKQEEVLEIPLKYFSNKELVDLGLSKSSKSGDWFFVGVVLVVLVCGFWYFYRKKQNGKIRND